MFDVGFSELLVIGIVALIVIGPERLPKVARTLGHLFGRMQRYVNDVKADIAREMELDELKKLRTTMEDAARSFEHSVTSEVNAAQTEIQKIAKEADPLTETAPAALAEQPASSTVAENAHVTPVENAHVTPPPEPTPQLELELNPQAPPDKRA